MNSTKFIPTEACFYYYKIRNKKKVYYLISNEHILTINIPYHIISNIKEYDNALIYHEASINYNILVEDLKFYKKEITEKYTLIEKTKKEIESFKIKYGSISFNYQDFIKDIPDFFYYTIIKSGPKKGTRIYYDYRYYLSADDNLIFKNKSKSSLKPKPKQQIVKFDRVKSFYSEIQPFQDKFIIISKIIILNSLEIYLFKLEKKYNSRLKKLVNIQNIIDQYKDFANKDVHDIKNHYEKLRQEFYIKRCEFYNLHYNKNYNNNYNNNYKKPDTIAAFKNILELHNIKSKKDFRLWALKNHPDKGGDTKLFQQINEATRNIYV